MRDLCIYIRTVQYYTSCHCAFHTIELYGVTSLDVEAVVEAGEFDLVVRLLVLNLTPSHLTRYFFPP